MYTCATDIRSVQIDSLESFQLDKGRALVRYGTEKDILMCDLTVIISLDAICDMP